MNHFFDKDARMANDKQKYLSEIPMNIWLVWNGTSRIEY